MSAVGSEALAAACSQNQSGPPPTGVMERATAPRPRAGLCQLAGGPMMGCRRFRSRAILALNLNQSLTRPISAQHKMYELQAWLIAIALILVIAMGARGVVSWHRYWRHRRNVSTLPDREIVEGIPRGSLREQRMSLATDLLNDASNLPAHETEVTHHALWMAMLLEATSDGSLDRREIQIVTDLFG